MIVGYGFREAVRRKMFAVVLVLTLLFLVLYVLTNQFVFSQLSVLGSRYASRHEVAEAARLVAAGLVRPVVTARAGIDDVDRIHDALRAGELLGRGARVWS